MALLSFQMVLLFCFVLGHTKGDDARIIGGSPAKKHEFAYQLRVSGPGGLLCGASLLSPSVCLTAAHCISNVTDATSLKVIAGDHLYNKNEDSEQIRIVQEAIFHPSFDKPKGHNDLALLKLALPFVVDNKTVEQITIAPASYEAVGYGIVTGWGIHKINSSEISNELLFAKLPIISDEECKVFYPPSVIDGTIICAGKKALATCHGDSGGPLAQDGILIGITSWGDKKLGCAQKPAVFTKVAKFHDWIVWNSK